jgi:molybdopterin converting factor small subunit
MKGVYREQIMGKVCLEFLPSLAETLGIERMSEEVISNQKIEGNKSVKDLLNQLCARYQRFGQVVFDTNTQELTGRVVIFVNGRTLELTNGLEKKLTDADTLTFVPLIEGG